MSSMMRDDGVRPSHQASILPLAVELFFVKTEAEIEAEQFRNSKRALAMKESSEREYSSRSHATLFHPFGRRKRNPKLVGA